MNLKKVDIKPFYGGLSDNLINSFYKPCLENSELYRRSTAYFTGGVYALAASSYKDFFIKNKGYIELVTSPFFDKNVHDAFKDYDQFKNDNIVVESLIENSLERLEETKGGKDLIELISILLGLNKLKIKIALVPEPGIHHEKVGIFKDPLGNSISFSGSINETWSGWNLNSEEFKVFNNWDLSARYWERDLINFESLWNDTKSNNKTVPLPQAIEENLIKIVQKNHLEHLENKLEIIEELINEDQIQLTTSKKTNHKTNRNQKSLMKHQEEVLASWEDNDRFGLVIHATGSGKTITGINAIKDWLEQGNVALVVVPSVVLLEQWIQEIDSEIEDANVFITGGEVPKSVWLKSLKFISAPNTDEKMIIVSTIATASSQDFRQAFKWGDHVLIVVDEVHRIGSNHSSKLMNDAKVGAALGLSATPERYGDEIGTKKIFDYFKNSLNPKFSLEDAIKVGRLVPYEYFPKTVELTDIEQYQYDELTEKITSLFFILEKEPNNKQIEDQYKRLLIKRARILKQAEKKPELALDILQKEYQEGQHWLVYCDDTNQLNTVIEMFSENGIKTLKYTSAMSGDRKQTLDLFKYNGGVLIAIKCLDEGVDLPYLSNAIILASSKNPREHIQRRGRVLRKAEGKFFAKIFDAVVVPNISATSLENDSIMVSELKRAISFAEGATNPKSKIDLIELAMKFNINFEDVLPTSTEEE